MTRAFGTVKIFNDDRGWGFIRPDSGPDLFVHRKHIHGQDRPTLSKGERVTYEIAEGERGPIAINVVRFEERGA